MVALKVAWQLIFHCIFSGSLWCVILWSIVYEFSCVSEQLANLAHYSTSL